MSDQVDKTEKQPKRKNNFNTKLVSCRLVYNCSCGQAKFTSYHKNHITKHFASKKHINDPDKDQMYDYMMGVLDYMRENKRFINQGSTVEDIKILKRDNYEKYDSRFVYETIPQVTQSTQANATQTDATQADTTQTDTAQTDATQ